MIAFRYITKKNLAVDVAKLNKEFKKRQKRRRRFKKWTYGFATNLAIL